MLYQNRTFLCTGIISVVSKYGKKLSLLFPFKGLKYQVVANINIYPHITHFRMLLTLLLWQSIPVSTLDMYYRPLHFCIHHRGTTGIHSPFFLLMWCLIPLELSCESISSISKCYKDILTLSV